MQGSGTPLRNEGTKPGAVRVHPALRARASAGLETRPTIDSLRGGRLLEPARGGSEDPPYDRDPWSSLAKADQRAAGRRAGTSFRVLWECDPVVGKWRGRRDYSLRISEVMARTMATFVCLSRAMRR